MQIQEISLDSIDHPEVEVRTEVDAEYISSLASSIKEVGLLHPINVRRRGERYEIISGNCRYLAARQAGLAVLPCVVNEEPEDTHQAIAMHENLLRQDVSHMDIAVYLNYLRTQKNKTVEELAAMFRLSATWVYQHLKLLDMDEALMEAVRQERLSYQSGLELMKLEDPVTRASLTDSAIRGGASISLIRGWVAQELCRQGKRPTAPPVSIGASMLNTDPITFTCAVCNGIFSSEKMILVRTCDECYTTVQKAIRLLRESETSGS